MKSFKAKPVCADCSTHDYPHGKSRYLAYEIERERKELKERDEYLAKDLQAFYKLNQGYSLMGVNSILMKVIKELRKK